jgi:hypothetical protein
LIVRRFVKAAGVIQIRATKPFADSNGRAFHSWKATLCAKDVIESAVLECLSQVDRRLGFQARSRGKSPVNAFRKV